MLNNKDEIMNFTLEEITSMPIDKEKHINERIGILETKVTHHQASLEGLIDKFDTHMADESENTKSVQATLVKVTNTVDNLTKEISRTNGNLSILVDSISPVVNKVNKWQIVINTISKFITIGAIVIGAIWAVFTFVVDHKESIQTVVKIVK